MKNIWKDIAKKINCPYHFYQKGTKLQILWDAFQDILQRGSHPLIISTLDLEETFQYILDDEEDYTYEGMREELLQYHEQNGKEFLARKFLLFFLLMLVLIGFKGKKSWWLVNIGLRSMEPE